MRKVIIFLCVTICSALMAAEQFIIYPGLPNDAVPPMGNPFTAALLRQSTNAADFMHNLGGSTSNEVVGQIQSALTTNVPASALTAVSATTAGHAGTAGEATYAGSPLGLGSTAIQLVGVDSGGLFSSIGLPDIGIFYLVATNFIPTNTAPRFINGRFWYNTNFDAAGTALTKANAAQAAAIADADAKTNRYALNGITNNLTSLTQATNIYSFISSNSTLNVVRDFGAVGDGATSDDVAFRNAYAVQVITGRRIDIPVPTNSFYLTNDFIITNRNSFLYGLGNANDPTAPAPQPKIKFAAGRGIIATEMSAQNQSDGGRIENIQVIVSGATAGITFSSTNGTSDCWYLGNCIFNGGAYGIRSLQGISASTFVNVECANNALGFFLTNGINQGNLFDIRFGNVVTNMEFHGLTSSEIHVKHSVTMSKVLNMEGCQDCSWFLGHIEWRGGSSSCLSSIGTGNNKRNTFYGGAVESDPAFASYSFECQDSAAFGSSYEFIGFNSSSSTNVGGFFAAFKMNDFSQDLLGTFPSLVAIYSGSTYVTNALLNPLFACKGSSTQTTTPYADWSFRPPRYIIPQYTNTTTYDYSSDLYGWQRVNVLSTNTPYIWRAGQVFWDFNGGSVYTNLITLIGGGNTAASGPQILFRNGTDQEDVGIIRGSDRAPSGGNYGAIMEIAASFGNSDHLYNTGTLQIWGVGEVHGKIAIWTNTVFASNFVATSSSGFSGNGSGLTNVTPNVATIVLTNFAIATLGSNVWARPIRLETDWVAVEAAVAGVCAIQLESPAALKTNRAMMPTLVTIGFVGNLTNGMSPLEIPVNGTWYFRDISSGIGNSAAPASGQIIIH